MEELLLEPNAAKTNVSAEASTSSGQQNMVGILQAQRDRYKERLDEVTCDVFDHSVTKSRLKGLWEACRPSVLCWKRKSQNCHQTT